MTCPLYRYRRCDPSGSQWWSRLFERAVADELESKVRPIIEDVKARGDLAVLEWTARFEGARLDPDRLRLSPQEFEEAERLLDGRVREALDGAIERTRAYHERQLPERIRRVSTAPGVWVEERIRPISPVGLYVPRGKGSFPSVMVMLGVPAAVAGVPRIVVCTPPDRDGRVDPATLYVARRLGIGEVYRVGGVQAIAALAWGAGQIPRVVKVLGPGSGYVTAAKRLLRDVVDVGLLAGPSEAMVLADASADPGLVALDLLNEAEHGPDSWSYVVTDSAELGERVRIEAERLLGRLSEERRSFASRVLADRGGIVVADSLEEAIDFVNRFAPEHLCVHVADPAAVLERIENAGEVIVGPHASIAMANYGVGPNAVLPTSGLARSASALSVHDFVKRVAVVYATAEGASAIHPQTAALADYEGFSAHALAARGRPAVAVSGADGVPSEGGSPDAVRGPVGQAGSPGVELLQAGPERVALRRTTRESRVSVKVASGPRDPYLKKRLRTSLQFLDHMLEHVAWRAELNLEVSVELSGFRLQHVASEDAGITLGEAIRELYRQRIPAGVRGSGQSFGTIDEALARVVLSFEERALCLVDGGPAPLAAEVEDMHGADLVNFLEGFSQGARCTLHVDVLKGRDPHHAWEAVFRALGECLREALASDPWRKGSTPGVKGI